MRLKDFGGTSRSEHAVVSTAAESKALVGAAVMWFAQGELERARRHSNALYPSPRSAGDMDSRRGCRVHHGSRRTRRGKCKRCPRLVQQQSGGISCAEHAVGRRKSARGDGSDCPCHRRSAEAERLLDEATSGVETIGPWFSLSFRLCGFARFWRCGAEARMRRSRFVRESLSHIRTLQDKFAFVSTLVPLAAAAVLKGDDVWAARILGARDAVTERTGATGADNAVHGLQEQVERDARTRLGPGRWAMAYAAGRKTSIDGLLKDIDDRSPLATPFNRISSI